MPDKDNLTEYGLIGALIAAGIMFVGSLLNNNKPADIPSAPATSPPPPPTPIKAGCGCNAGNNK